MEKGDISNEITPRILLVFEGFVGEPATAADKAAATLALRVHRWKTAVQHFEINQLVAQHIWDAVWRRHYTVDIITFLGDGFRDALEARLDEEELPVGRVRSSKPNLLARELIYAPHILAVYDPDPSHVFTYGSKGRVVSAAAPDFFGV